MNKIFSAYLILASIFSNAQFVGKNNPTNGTYQRLSPTGEIIYELGKNHFIMYSDSIMLGSLDAAHMSTAPTSIVWADINGMVRVSKVDSLNVLKFNNQLASYYLNYNNLTNKPTIPTQGVTSVTMTSSDLDITGVPITSTGTIVSNLKVSGVSAGTYNNLVVNNKGIATSGSNIAYLTSEVDGSITNEIQNLGSSKAGNNVSVTISGGASTSINICDPDSSISNELQNLSISSGNILNISSGTGVTLPSLVKFITKAGLISNNAAFFADTFTVSTNNPTISLSSYITANGYTGCLVTSAVGFKSGAPTAGNSPQVSVNALSTTGTTLTFTQANNAVVTILGINVLSGGPLVLLSDFTNVKVLISAIFY